MEEIINTCEYYKICESDCGGTLEDTECCSCYILYKQLKRLELENKLLKADYEASEQENAELKEYEYFYLDKYIDLKQALEEIRGIAKREYDKSIIEKDFHESDACIWVIIRKINEVLND